MALPKILKRRKAPLAGADTTEQLAPPSYSSEVERSDRLSRMARLVESKPGSLAILFAPMALSNKADVDPAVVMAEFGRGSAEKLRSAGVFPDDLLEFAVLSGNHGFGRDITDEEKDRASRLVDFASATASYFMKLGLEISHTTTHHSLHREDTILAIEEVHREVLTSKRGESAGVIAVISALDAQYATGRDVGQDQINVQAGGVLVPSVSCVAGDNSPLPVINWTEAKL